MRIPAYLLGTLLLPSFAPQSTRVEFVGGTLVTHRGEAMPRSALCNAPYADEMTVLREYAGFGNQRALTEGKTLPRFVAAAVRLKQIAKTPRTLPRCSSSTWTLVELATSPVSCSGSRRRSTRRARHTGSESSRKQHTLARSWTCSRDRWG